MEQQDAAQNASVGELRDRIADDRVTRHRLVAVELMQEAVGDGIVDIMMRIVAGDGAVPILFDMPRGVHVDDAEGGTRTRLVLDHYLTGVGATLAPPEALLLAGALIRSACKQLHADRREANNQFEISP